MYIPGTAHQLFGLLRVNVKDSNDEDEGSLSDTFLDSDGRISDNDRRPIDNKRTANVTDGAWHMVTLTTHADKTPGFLLYVDGKIAGDMVGSATDLHVSC